MKMEINLPDSAQVTGELRDDFEVGELDQDIMQIQMPNGYYIDVGWTPEYDQSGQFQIVVFHRRWEDQKCSVRTSNLDQAIRIIEDLAWIYIPSQSSSSIAVKASSLTVTKMYRPANDPYTVLVA